MFEVRRFDLGGRLGKIRTRHGDLETPAFLPVIHPVVQSVSAKEIGEMGFKAVMTNSYITLKRHGDKAIREGIHSIIGFDGAVMTDSGGYQVLRYGDVAATPLEIGEFQEKIGSDFAIVLDRPTGIRVDHEDAEVTVESTLESCATTLKAVGGNRRSIWIGPVQGGRHLDLVRLSAERTSRMDFDMFSIGSPVEVMEMYDFKLLANMITAAKESLPQEKPVHLFGLGHPLPLSLAVALGCDTFDSASYMLYARKGRYMTENGTRKIEDLDYLPCVCAICSRYSIDEIRSLERRSRERALAIHNLLILKREVESTKEAIAEGRLWEYLASRCRVHPRLWRAFEEVAAGSNSFELLTPIFKRRGLMLSSYPDHLRPEVLRSVSRIERYLSGLGPRPLLILPIARNRTFLKSEVSQLSINELIESSITIGYISIPFGFVPAEISDIYPFSQVVGANIESDPRVLRDSLLRLRRQFSALAPERTFLMDDGRLGEALIGVIVDVLRPELTFHLSKRGELSGFLAEIKSRLEKMS